jgi:hypothetical protein
VKLAAEQRNIIAEAHGRLVRQILLEIDEEKLFLNSMAAALEWNDPLVWQIYTVLRDFDAGFSESEFLEWDGRRAAVLRRARRRVN